MKVWGKWERKKRMKKGGGEQKDRRKGNRKVNGDSI